MTDHTADTPLDMLIVGAGLSGIGMACYLERLRPGTRYQILEAREDLGGTWDLFRYPGIRSDSDLYTFGFAFKPWTGDNAIADAASIMRYLRETTVEYQLTRHIQYQQRVHSANWSGAQGCWEVVVENLATQQRRTLRCRWLFSAAGYYRYEAGYTPDFPGMECFNGLRVHPQQWPADLDYAGKRIVVIGSGATAVTLAPALAKTAAHVTLLQRTPSYVLSLPAQDKLALWLRKVLPTAAAYRLSRYKNARLSLLFWRFCRRFPNAARRLIRHLTHKALPANYPVDEHFKPTYQPWDQRLCLIPNGDLFKALGDGSASIVTDQIATFTPTGITLQSGKTLDADIIVTATGLDVQLFGGIQLSIEQQPVAWHETVAYKGMMLSGVPNFAFALGYTNASWTLKVSLLCEHLCRVLTHMDEHHHSQCCPRPPANLVTRPLLDFAAGYVQRALHSVPRQGAEEPWTMSMDYFADIKTLRKGPVTHPDLHFSGTAAPGMS